MRLRKKFRDRLAHRAGMFTAPLGKVPAKQRQFSCVCRAKAKNGARARCVIFRQWPGWSRAC